MKIENKDSGEIVVRADLILEGQQDVEMLRRALASYDRFVTDTSAPFVIPLPLRPDG